jgi:2,3-bisphosphoglycerate-dependent phosphoglycerate mutase
MYLENITPQEIIKVNIPTGTPRAYVLDENLKILSVNYL